jgi:thiol-disulfide isomerase/thioredoxin
MRHLRPAARAFGVFPRAAFARLAFAVAAACLPLLPAAARAATVAPFTEAAFKAAEAQGRPILLDIFATWCPTCAAQKPIIAHLSQAPEFHDLLILRVNFDTQKAVVRAIGARMQSTLVAFHGATLKGVSVGETDPAAIKALLVKAEG